MLIIAKLSSFKVGFSFRKKIFGKALDNLDPRNKKGRDFFSLTSHLLRLSGKYRPNYGKSQSHRFRTP